MKSYISGYRCDLLPCLLAACIVHIILLLFGLGTSAISVTTAHPGAVEVSLTASEPRWKPSAPRDEYVRPSACAKQSVPEAQTPAHSATCSPVATNSVHETGMQTIAQPCYLQNRPPLYPEKARRLGQQGLTLLTVRVGSAGNAIDVRLKTGSGHGILDDAAIKAVKCWTFEPARIGSVPIESDVEVPVRFRLEKSPG